MSAHDHRAIAAAITQAAEAINHHRTIEETLDAIVGATRSSIPGFEHVSLTLVEKGGRLETKAGTHQLAWELDRLQYSLGEGPCVDAINEHTVVPVPHARHDQRWPRYIPAAVQQGLRSQLGVRLVVDGQVIGGLNLYSTESDDIDPEALHSAELFATHAAIALGHARHDHEMSQAVASRKTIGQAIGILMERYQLDQDRALQFLMRASQTSNIKLREIAEELVATTDAQHRHQA